MRQKLPRTILFIDTTHVAVGGVGARQVRLAQALPSRGWRPIFALTQGRRFHDPARYMKALPPFEHLLLDGRTGSADGRRLAIEDALRRVRPDVVLPGAVLDGWAVAEENKKAGGFRIIYGLPGIHINCLSFVRSHAARIDGAFAVGPVTVRLLGDYCGLPEDRVFLVPTGVSPCSRSSPSEVRRPIRLLYVGRFDPDKRVLDAIALADELEARNLEFRLTLVGAGLHAPELEAAVSRRRGRLVISPPVTPQALYESFYPEADAILLFSESEGLPNSLLEGMAHALVPITSDFRGRDELGLFRHEETALVFGVGHIHGAARCVEQLAAKPGLKAEIGARVRQIVERERGVDQMADAFVRVLKRAMEGPPRLGAGDAIPSPGTSRLRRFVGARAAERVRRLFGLGFEHPDASEWPLIDNIVPFVPEEAVMRLQTAIQTSEPTLG